MQKNIKYGLAYLFPIIAPLILLFALNDNDKEDKCQLGQAIVFGITLIIVGIVLGALSAIPVLGFIFTIANSLIGVAALIVAILYFTGRTFEFPLLYDLGSKLTNN